MDILMHKIKTKAIGGFMENTINFTKFKIFQNNGHKYIYCVKDSKICEVDDRTLALLNQSGKTYDEIKDTLGPLFYENELNGLINQMETYGFIEKEMYKSKKRHVEVSSDISSLLLLVVQDCNLRCSYCYADGGNYQHAGVMDIDTAKQSVDFLIKKSANENLGICFFGGEPLLNLDLIKEIVYYCRNKEKETNKKFGFSMTTNGTLINSEIENFIIENNIKTQISIDGGKETQDANRYYSGKIGSHDTVIKKTNFLRKKGLLDARATITMKELNLVHIYDYLQSIGFRQITMSPAFNLFSAGEYDMLADAYIHFYLNFENRIKEKKYSEVKNNRMFMQELTAIHNSKTRGVACGVAQNLYAIDVNGEIYPCQRFVGCEEFVLSSVFQDDSRQKEFLSNISIDNYTECHHCWIRNLCVGGCPHDNFSSTGDINSPYEPFCKYKKKIITSVINIYLRLSDEEIGILFDN